MKKQNLEIRCSEAVKKYEINKHVYECKYKGGCQNQLSYAYQIYCKRELLRYKEKENFRNLD